jgi:hypothetical protein
MAHKDIFSAWAGAFGKNRKDCVKNDYTILAIFNGRFYLGEIHV